MNEPDRERTHRDLAFTAFVFVLALLPRLYVAIAWAKEPVWDGHYYDFGARQIARGFGYADEIAIAGAKAWHPWCHYPVGYSAFLAIAYRVFGDGPHVAPIVNAVTGAVLAAATHRFASYGLSIWRARFASLLVALSPELVVYAALLMTEPLASLAPILAGWIVLRDPKRFRAAIFAGITIGLGALVRPQNVIVAPFLFLLVVERFDAPSWKRGLAIASIATGAALATVAPWTIRNCRVMDGCAFVSTNAGWNLAIGAFSRATGRFETLRATDGCPVVTGQVQQDRCWMKLGIESIERDPRRWLALVPKKLSFTFDHASFPIGYLGEADRGRWSEEAKARGREVLTGGHRALVALAAFVCVAAFFRLRKAVETIQAALFGVVAALVCWVATHDEPKPFWILAVFAPLVLALPIPGAPRAGPVVRFAAFQVLAVAITHAIFFGEDRYHVVATPALALLAAAAFGAIPRRASDAEPAAQSDAANVL